MVTIKKRIALLLVVFIMLAITACGTTAPETPSEPESPSVSSETEEEAPEVLEEEEQEVEEPTSAEEWPAVTIEYWHMNNETQGGPVVDKMIEKFNQTNGKNITVIGKFIAGQYGGITQELQASLAAGIYPGVIQAGFAYLNYYAENFPQFTGPNEVIEKYSPEDAGYLEEHFAQGMLELSRAANGRLIGIPYSASVPMLYINRDLFKAADLDPDNPPQTLQEVVEYGRIIKEKTGEYGFYIQSPADTWINSPMMIGNGVQMYEVKDGKVTPTFYRQESVEVWKLLQEAYKEGVSVNIPFEDGTGAFAGGKFGMNITTVARKAYFENNSNFDLGATYFPASGEGKDRKVCVGGNMLMLFAKTDAEIKASWEFMKFLYAEENAVDWTIETGYLVAALLNGNPAENNKKLKEFLDNDSLMQVAFNSLAFAVPNVSWPGANGLQVETILVDMRDSILSNYEDVDTAMKTASDKISALLE